MSGRFFLLATLGLLAVFWGCGHDVSPTDNFRDPDSIPLCCATDPEPGCCGLAAFGFSQGVNLSWFSEDEVFAFIDGWHVYRAEGTVTPPASAYRRINGDLFTERTLVDSDVSDGTTYWYRLTSVSAAGIESQSTAPVSVRVDMTPPNPPTGLAAVAGAGAVDLSWNPSPEPDLSHYNIFREPPVPAVVFGPIPPDASDYADTQAQRGNTYRYWITAVDIGLNESAPGDTVEIFYP